MEREYVDSSMFKSIGYEEHTATLEIEYKNGSVYQYYDFPESKWYEFKSAESQGKYYHAEIRGQYHEGKVG